MTLTRVNSNGITDGTIADADVSASAAIAGTKVSPDFGSQATTTTGTSTAASFIPTGSSVPANGVYLPGANALGLATASTERVRVTSAGLVGIGNTTAGSYNAGFNQLVVGSSGDQGVTIVSGTSNSGTLAFADGTSGADAYRGYVQYQHGSTNALVFATDGSERFRCDSSGRLLVGTSSARENFQNGAVTARVQIEGTDYQQAALSLTVNNSGGTQRPTLYFNKSNGSTIGSNTAVASGDWLGQIIFAGSDGSEFVNGATIQAEVDGGVSANDMPTRLVFSTTPDSGSSPVERLRINQAGNMSFNGTDTTSSNGQIGQVYKFFGGANNVVLAFESTATDKNALFEYRRSGRSGSARASQIQIGENTSNQGIIDVYSSAADAGVSGGVRLVNGATSWSSISDIRLKNVASHFNNALNDVSALDAFRFTWKDDPSETPQVGLSAQSVQAVLPEAIASGKPVNAPEGDDTEYLSVRYTEVIPLLVAALQESKERIEQLEAKVAALEAS